MSKLNWRLILIHLVASWFFIYAFKVFISLNDYEFLTGMMQLKIGEGINPGRLNNDLLLLKLSGPAGLLLACLISLFICLKKQWYWLNTVIVFVIAFLLDKFELFGWNFLQSVFLEPGNLLKLEVPSFYIVNGIIMLVIGMLVFLMSWSKKTN